MNKILNLIIFILLLLLSKFSLSQVFFLKSGDTIYYDSKLYPNVKVGKVFYNYPGNPVYNKANNTFINYLRKCKITNIHPINYELKKYEEFYRTVYVDNYIEYKVLSERKISGKNFLDEGIWPDTICSILLQEITIAFDKEPKFVFADLGNLVLVNDSTKIDLVNRRFIINNKVDSIFKYAFFTCKFYDGSEITVYDIWVYQDNYIYKGLVRSYYIVTEKNKIIQWYYYREP